MEKKFIWYGLNKQFNDIVHSHAMTTTDLLNGNYPSWMALKNRGENGNCDFIAECLFTGLKDKNGKEIYECDILKITLYDDEWKTTVRDYYGTLIVDVEGCDWNTTALSFLDDEAEIEVIGNIYENPELLSTPTAVL